MANLRDIRNRIKAVKNTGKITRAMQLVAASKMKRAQDAALAGHAYTLQLMRMLATLNGRVGEFKHPYLEERTIKTEGVLILSTDRGLCGPLNSNLFREAVRFDRDNTRFITVGRKATQFISRTHRNLMADFTVSDKATFREVRPIVECVVDAYLKGEIDSIKVLYPRFRNTLVQEPSVVNILPLSDLDEILKKQEVELETDPRDITFEPDAGMILEELLGLYVKREIYQLVLDTKASEHSARMVAMKAATDNAKNLVGDLTLQYNKARQASITQEILEITAAAMMTAK